MFDILRQNIKSNLKNIPGWKTDRRIVVIECDDWGGIRMPDRSVYDFLLQKGLIRDNKRFNRFDTLETHDDLASLFEVLKRVSDRNGRPAVMTAVTNVANPDFEKIRESGFTEYHYEAFTETLKRYYPSHDVISLWKQGITEGIFKPELHGREHLNVNMWMQKLREGDAGLQEAFGHEFVYMYNEDLPAPVRDFRAAFYFTSEDEKPFLVRSITDGVTLFREIFGFAPGLFVPANGIFHPDFDRVVSECGVKFLYVFDRMPYPAEGGSLKYRRFVTGRRGPGDITYYTRNCVFEPTDEKYMGIGFTLRQIEAAFRWNKPAFISTHRVNFAGGIDTANRDKGLRELRMLLIEITARWPDVEFMSASEALGYMRSGN